MKDVYNRKQYSIQVNLGKQVYFLGPEDQITLAPGDSAVIPGLGEVKNTGDHPVHFGPDRMARTSVGVGFLQVTENL